MRDEPPAGSNVWPNRRADAKLQQPNSNLLATMRGEVVGEVAQSGASQWRGCTACMIEPAFVPVLQQQDTPSVMCSTASVGGISRGDGGGAAYQGSKAAIVSISETLSFELARRYPQVRVHVLW